MAIVAALILGIAGCFAFGLGAAIWMGSVYGSNSGGTEMSSFFTFGPVGALAGILIGVGLVFHFHSGPARWAKGLMIGAAALTALAVLVLSGLALAHPSQPVRSRTSVAVFEVEFPAAAAVETSGWSFDGGSISSVEKHCTTGTCTLVFVIPLAETFSGTVLTLTGGEYQFVVDPASVLQASDWSEWRSSKATRFRYRVSRD